MENICQNYHLKKQKTYFYIKISISERNLIISLRKDLLIQ